MKCLIFLVVFTFFGCGQGKEDDTQSSSSSTVEVNDCSGATFESLDAEQVAELVEAAGENAEVIVEEQGLNQENALRQFKVTIIQGCGNNVNNEDNDSTSDDDTVVDFGSSEDASV